MCLLHCYARPFALRCSKRNESFVQSRTDSFPSLPLISPLRTRLLDARDRCRVCILPNIRRKNRRDIDGTLGISALRFDGIALCVAKPSESSVVECCHRVIVRYGKTRDKRVFSCTTLEGRFHPWAIFGRGWPAPILTYQFFFIQLVGMVVALASLPKITINESTCLVL